MADTSGKAPQDESMTKLRLTCLCGGVKASFSVPDSALPLPFEICHCETCRHQSGQLAIQACEIPPQHRSSFSVEGSIAKYDATGKLLRYFCHTCGANIYFEDIDTKDIFFDIGLLEWEGRSDLLKAAQHIFVSDTTDGGMSVWLPDLPVYPGHPDAGPEVPLKDLVAPKKAPVTSTPSSTAAKEEDYLPCYCRCKAIQFKISRPNEQSRETVAGPYADLLKPFVSTPHDIRQNKDNEPWHLSQPSSTRYTAGLCACNTCRKSSGFDIQPWAFIPLVNLHEAEDGGARPLDIDAMKKTTDGFLKTHYSSPGKYRDFCGRCGATIFWHCDERPGLIDVSIGLMEAPEGARAEDWLDLFTGRVSFEEEAVNKSFVGSLKEGLKAWGDEARG